MKPSSLSGIPSRDARLFIDRARQSQDHGDHRIDEQSPVISGLPTVKAFIRDGNAKTRQTGSHVIMVTHGMNVTLYDYLF